MPDSSFRFAQSLKRPMMGGTAYRGVLRWCGPLGAVGALLLTWGSMSTGGRAEFTGLALSGAPWLVSGSGQIAGIIATWLGVVLLFAVWIALYPAARRGILRRRIMRRHMLWWALPLLPALPLFSGDAWSYLAQGDMLSSPYDPYIDGPLIAGGPFAAFVHPDWRFTPAPYGPLQLWLLQGIGAVSGHHPWIAIMLLRIVVFAAVALIVWCLEHLAYRTTTNSGLVLWLGAANPLVIAHLIGGLHNDVFALAITLAALLSAAVAGDPHRTPVQQARWIIAAGLLFGLAIGIKVTAFIALPFAVWFASRNILAALVRGIALSTCAFLCIVAITFASGAGFGWIGALSVSGRVVNWLSLPTAAAHLFAAIGLGEFENLLVLTRRVGTVLLLLIFIGLWWLARSPQRATATSRLRRGLVGLACAWSALFLLNSVSWPWYWVAAIALVPLFTRAQSVIALAIGLVVFQLLAIGPSGSVNLYTPAFAILAVIAGIGTSIVFARIRAVDSGYRYGTRSASQAFGRSDDESPTGQNHNAGDGGTYN